MAGRAQPACRPAISRTNGHSAPPVDESLVTLPPRRSIRTTPRRAGIASPRRPLRRQSGRCFSGASALTRIPPVGTALRMPDLRPRRTCPLLPAPGPRRGRLPPLPGTRTAWSSTVGRRWLGAARRSAPRRRATGTAPQPTPSANAAARRGDSTATSPGDGTAPPALGASCWGDPGKYRGGAYSGCRLRTHRQPGRPAVVCPSRPCRALPEPVLVAGPPRADVREGYGRDGGPGRLALRRLLPGCPRDRGLVAAARADLRTRALSGLLAATATATTLGTAESWRARAGGNRFRLRIGTRDTRPEWPAGQRPPSSRSTNPQSICRHHATFGRQGRGPRRLPSSSAANPREAAHARSSCSRCMRRRAVRRVQRDRRRAQQDLQRHHGQLVSMTRLRASSRSLQDLPHTPSLQKTWRTTVCQRTCISCCATTATAPRAGFVARCDRRDPRPRSDPRGRPRPLPADGERGNANARPGCRGR